MSNQWIARNAKLRVSSEVEVSSFGQYRWFLDNHMGSCDQQHSGSNHLAKQPLAVGGWWLVRRIVMK